MNGAVDSLATNPERVDSASAQREFDSLARLLADRGTCRQYLPDPVDRALIKSLLRMAQRSPSGCNSQPWRVEVTSGAATERFRAGFRAHVLSEPESPDFAFPVYAGRYRDRRRECGWQLYDSLGIGRDDLEERSRQVLRNFEFFDAPHVAIVTTEADLGTYGVLDCGIFVSSFLLGAQALGLGAAPQAALASYSGFVREFFDLPEERRVVVGISFGYPDRAAAVNGFRTSRAPVEDVVTWHES